MEYVHINFAEFLHGQEICIFSIYLLIQSFTSAWIHGYLSSTLYYNSKLLRPGFNLWVAEIPGKGKATPPGSGLENSMEKSMGLQRSCNDWAAFTLFSCLNCSNLGYKELFHLVLVLLWHKFIYYFGASLPSGSAKCSRSSWYFLLQAWNRISKEPWFMVLEMVEAWSILQSMESQSWAWPK